MHAKVGGGVKFTSKPTSHPSTDTISSLESLLLKHLASDKEAVRYY
jgi:hypothetical protein